MKDIIPTGFLRLDLDLGVGGLRRGQITDIFGRANSGKSMLCYTILSQAQREGGVVALIDADRSFNRFVAEAAQIETDRIIVATPDCAEDALGMTNIFVHSAGFSAVAIDSLDSLVPLAELNQPLGEYAFRDFSELLSRWLPRMAQDLLRTNTLLLVTRSDPDAHHPVYHNLKTNLHRLALSFHAAQRLQLTRNDNTAIEFPIWKIQIKIVKNIFSPCFKTKSLDIIVNRSVNKIIETLEIGEQLGLITEITGNYFYREILLGSTRGEVIRFLEYHPEVVSQIELAIRQRFFTS